MDFIPLEAKCNSGNTWKYPLRRVGKSCVSTCITMYLLFFGVNVYQRGGFPMRLIGSQGMFLFFGSHQLSNDLPRFRGNYEVQDGNLVLVTQLTWPRKRSYVWRRRSCDPLSFTVGFRRLNFGKFGSQIDGLSRWDTTKVLELPGKCTGTSIFGCQMSNESIHWLC